MERKHRSRWRRKLVLLPLIVIFGMYFLSYTAPYPENLGVVDGQLSGLPDTPNCVSTQTSDTDRKMEPIQIPTGESNMMTRIAEAVKSMPRARIVKQDSHYLHAEFTSLIFRFVDDVEFLIDDTERVVHFRSASRVGHSDLGANRRRMTLLKEKIQNE